MNEDVIILLAKQGQEDAFRQLYEAHREKIYRTAFRYTKNQQDAEDIMHETFIKAFRKIDTFDFQLNASFSSWLYRICIHSAIELLRKRKRRKTPQTDSLSDLANDPEAVQPSPEKSAVINQTIYKLKHALHVLSPKQMVIFDMRYSQHMDIKEIAKHLNCSESTVKTQHLRAVSKLRKHLEPLWGKL